MFSFCVRVCFLLLCASVSQAGPRPLTPPVTAQAVMNRVLDTAGLHPSQTRSLKARLHLSALLPQFRVTFGRGWQLLGSRDVLGDASGPENDRLSYAIYASWDLAKLLHPHDELSLLKEEQRRAALRLRLQERVLQFLAERCRRLTDRAAHAQKLHNLEETLLLWMGDRVAGFPPCVLSQRQPATEHPLTLSHPTDLAPDETGGETTEPGEGSQVQETADR